MPDTAAGEACLALPKLNLQFLTFHDYLLRNFNLFRLEATYEVPTNLSQPWTVAVQLSVIVTVLSSSLSLQPQDMLHSPCRHCVPLLHAIRWLWRYQFSASFSRLMFKHQVTSLMTVVAQLWRACAQVREDLADVLQRVGASWDEEQEDPVVKFRGWARMAMPLAGFDIIEVKPPKVRDLRLFADRGKTNPHMRSHSVCAAVPRMCGRDSPGRLLRSLLLGFEGAHVACRHAVRS